MTWNETWNDTALKKLGAHLMLPNLTWNETWNDTSLKKQVTLEHVGLKSFLSHSYLKGLVVAGLDNSSLIFWDADQIMHNR